MIDNNKSQCKTYEVKKQFRILHHIDKHTHDVDNSKITPENLFKQIDFHNKNNSDDFLSVTTIEIKNHLFFFSYKDKGFLVSEYEYRSLCTGNLFLVIFNDILILSPTNCVFSKMKSAIIIDKNTFINANLIYETREEY